MTRTIFTLTILRSATLLFLVQPLFGRFLFPIHWGMGERRRLKQKPGPPEGGPG